MRPLNHYIPRGTSSISRSQMRASLRNAVWQRIWEWRRSSWMTDGRQTTLGKDIPGAVTGGRLCQNSLIWLPTWPGCRNWGWNIWFGTAFRLWGGTVMLTAFSEANSSGKTVMLPFWIRVFPRCGNILSGLMWKPWKNGTWMDSNWIS